MLQQTRVAAVLPYYDRFLARFPTVRELAEAREEALLATWAGLGYYSRARNVQKAAVLIQAAGEFPRDYESIRALPGIGDYTAAAVASIAFELPHAAIDGNALRVVSRVMAEPGDIGCKDTRKRIEATANEWLDRKHPGDFNQAVMELGATICLPKSPECSKCPLARYCAAHSSGRTAEYPVKIRKTKRNDVEGTLFYIERGEDILFWRRDEASKRLAGFWELPGPAQLKRVGAVRSVGEFRHTIVNTTFHFRVVSTSVRNVPSGLTWVSKYFLHELPLSTTAKKAMWCLESRGATESSAPESE